MEKFMKFVTDAFDLLDGLPSTPVLLIGVVIGAIIPFKLLTFAAIIFAVWYAIQHLD